MSRYTDPVCKLCRREGKKLFLKGERCYTNKCSVERRSYAPGQHGRRYYGIQESQFRKYFEMAERRQGVTGENLLRICESRLDNVVYLLGWASSRAEGRQLVNHGHFQVNGKKVNIPSYLLRAGDVVTIKQTSRDSEKIKATVEANASRPVPQWLDLDRENLQAKIVNLPERDQIAVPVEEHLIVEFYSK